MKPLTLDQALRETVGYLNFSSGQRNPRFFAAVNRLFLEAAGIDPQLAEELPRLEFPPDTSVHFQQLLREAPARVRQADPTFRDTRQAENVVRLALDVVIPAYREFHRDLLGFHEPAFFYQPFFVARVLEAILRAGEPWGEEDRIIKEALRLVNDYVGYRPVPVLQTRRYEPYEHEKICPIPLYLRGAGVAYSPYAPLVAQALRILRDVPHWIARQADFDFDQLEELAVDPRALDFQHPVQHRPNYIYGTWDLHRFDKSGRYCRYVAQQAILDFLTVWINEQLEHGGRGEDIVFQAAAVFSGTILMAMGVTGGSPAAIPSTENLGRLVVKIAAYREQFYEWLRARAPHSIRTALEDQFNKYRSHFAEVRRSLNRRLNDYRAQQAHRGRFLQLMAELGQQEVVDRQLDRIYGATGRITTRIYAAIHACQALVEKGDLEKAAAQLPEIFALILRGIDCGGLVDPWNALGFGGLFPLAPSPEDSIPDERIGQLVMLVERLFDLHAELMKAAAAVGKTSLVEAVNNRLRQLAEWWDQFATTKVSEIISFSGRLAQQSAEAVAHAIAAWYQAGAASGDIAFWRQHVGRFPSVKAFFSAAETLLDHGDLVSALALLIQWASLGEEVGIREGSHHLPAVAARWIHMLWENSSAGKPRSKDSPQRFPQPQTPQEKWQWTRRFFDYLEANGTQWWQVPSFRLAEDIPQLASGDQGANDLEGGLAPESEDVSSSLFAAAYEGVIFRESALDGIDSDLIERGFQRLQSALAEELKRLSDHAFFLAALGGMWQYTAMRVLAHPELDTAETLERWAQSAATLSKGLERLAVQVLRYPVLPDSPSAEDMSECGMRLQMKDALLARILEAWIKLEEARWMLAVILPGDGWRLFDPSEEHLVALGQLFRAVLCEGPREVRKAWRLFRAKLGSFSTCFVPIEKGGKPRQFVAARVALQLLSKLLAVLPRRGYLRYSLQLLQELLTAERSRESSGAEASQLALLFFAAAESLTRAVVTSAQAWDVDDDTRRQRSIELINTLLKSIDILWRRYNSRIVLSPIERLSLHWEAVEELYDFIRRFGRDLFTQTFLNYGNLLTITRMGAANYIKQAIEHAGSAPLPELFEKIRDGIIPLPQAATVLGAIVEPIISHYTHYIDYNASTVESDRGDNLHILLRHLQVVALVDRVTWTYEPYLCVYRTLLKLDQPALAEHVAHLFEQKVRPELDTVSFWLQEVEKLTGVQLATVRRVVDQAIDYPVRVERMRDCTRRLACAESPEEASAAASALEELAEELLRKPRETGFQEPDWLDVIRQEFQRQEKVIRLLESNLYETPAIEHVPLEFTECLRQCQLR
ncbi:MAG: hypothetical protein NZ899_10525 [Thermoguttaceae bacterium]|nr:hypothetical protein [Thermoguttaceae bacterium]MDW8078160.1 hypothetical protein [Thermoguttaceae bacterium]